jgi:hypothetical protein
VRTHTIKDEPNRLARWAKLLFNPGFAQAQTSRAQLPFKIRFAQAPKQPGKNFFSNSILPRREKQGRKNWYPNSN